MAGESPGKSEQQKSSGETTPGERDPRLAVFRESAAEEAEPESGSESGSRSGSGSGSESGSESRSAVATKVATANRIDGAEGSQKDSEEAGDSGKAEKSEKSAGSDDGPPIAAGAESSKSESAPKGDSDSELAAEAEAEADADSDSGSDLSSDSDTNTDADADSSSESTSDADSGRTRESEEPPAAEKAETSGEAEKEGKAGKGGTTPSWARSGDVGAAEASKDAKDAPSDKSKDKAEDKKDGVKDDDVKSDVKSDAKGDDESDDDAEPRVDRATAVFKALPRPAVDSPTTALKMPRPSEGEKSAKSETPEKGVKAGANEKPGSDVKAGANEKPGSDAKAGSEDKPRSDAKAKTDEAPAERTSTFVPLRRDDVPSTASKPTSPRTMSLKTASPQPEASPSTSKSTPQPPAATPAVAETSAIPEAERTRQQPMPPRPPLDLLAELTNKPAPPETPVRTAVRRVKIWTPLALLLLVIFAIAQAVRPLPAPTLALSADPTYTFEGGKIDMPWPAEGQGAVEVEGVGTIGAYGAQKSAPLASVAKVMTAYVILKEHPISGNQVGPKIKVDKKAGEEADRPDESTAPIEEGQQYTEKQMLQLLMIPSGNNAARLLARWDATTEKAFVEKMNAAAKDLGMTNSTYTDPSGLEPSTVSTPADQLKLAKAVMQNDVFREVVNMPQADVPGLGKTIYNNNNILLEPGVSGIKTGSSTPAGGNLLWAANTIIDGKDRRIVGIVMGAQVDGTLDGKLQRSIQNSLKLIQKAQADVGSATVVKKGDVVGYVDDGLGGQTPVVSTEDLKAIGWGGLEVKLNIGEGKEQIPHAAAAGSEVGEVTVGTGTGKVSAPVTLQKDLVEPGFGAKLTRVG